MSLATNARTFFLGVGAEKAGTSWVDRQLAAHPEVWTPPHKEIHYFDAIHLSGGQFYRKVKYDAFRSTVMARDWRTLASDPAELATVRWLAQQGLADRLNDEWYVSLFSQGTDGVGAIGEVTPAYAALPVEGWRHIHRLEPSTRIVFLMREPGERLWSALRYFANNRPESGVLDSVDRMKRFVSRPNNVAKTRYDLTIQHLRTFFDESQLLFAFYEDVFASSVSQSAFLSELCAFLGVSPSKVDASRMGGAVNASPPAPMPDQLRAYLRFEYLPMIMTVRTQIGRVPELWMA